MARSNTGGTRGFIRGKVAQDLYQVTTDKKGRKIQLVRAVEQSRENPNTKYQALARMQMALLMGSLKQFKEIVDHSFETIPYGQLSIAHFVEINMPLIQADCRDHWEENNLFDYPSKGTTHVRLGLFKIAEGSLSLPSAISWGNLTGSGSRAEFLIDCGKASPKISDLKAALGANANDYITALVLCGLGLRQFNRFKYLRFYINDTLPDTTVITSANFYDVFRIEGNLSIYTVSVNGSGVIKIVLRYQENGSTYYMYERAVICSVWNGVKWLRNDCTFDMMTGVTPESVPFETAQYNFDSWWPDYEGESYDELFPDRV